MKEPTGVSLYLSEQTVLQLDWDVEVTDSCDAVGKAFPWQSEGCGGFGHSVVNTSPSSGREQVELGVSRTGSILVWLHTQSSRLLQRAKQDFPSKQKCPSRGMRKV